MNSSEEQKDKSAQQKSVRAIRFAIGAVFLLALTWSINSFFIWFFFGIAIFAVFMAYYYKPHVPEAEAEEWKSPSHENEGKTKLNPGASRRMVYGLMAFMGLLFASVFVRFLLSSGPAETGNSSSTFSIDSLTEKGNQLYNRGSYDSALLCYNAVLKMDGENVPGMYNKGLVLFATQQYEQARPILLACLGEKSDYKEAWWLLGDIYSGMQDADSARICFDKAYENSLRDAGFLKMMAESYERVSVSRAVELYEESLAQDSAQSEIYGKLIQLVPSEAAEYEVLRQKWQNGK